MQLNIQIHKNRYRVYTFLFILACFLMLAVFSGCHDDSDSSSSDTNPDSTVVKNSLLNGTHYTGLILSSTSSVSNQIATMVFDGEGSYDYTTLYDSTGGSYSSNGLPYKAMADGLFHFTGSDASGIVSPDGNITAYTDTEPAGEDNDIYMGVSIERSTGMSTASLVGNFIVCQIRHDGTSGATSRFLVNFDGAGSLTLETLADSGSGTGSYNGTYSVSDNGSLDFTITGLGKSFQGQVSESGDAILVLDDDDDGEVQIMVGLKKTTGAGNALFSGNYQANQLAGDDDGAWTTRVRTAVDGAGGSSATVVASSKGDSGTHTSTYTVSSDGTLECVGLGTGILSADGTLAVVADTTGSDVSLSVLIKKQ